MRDSKRIRSLDGLRGLAILLVLLFHAYARWPDLVPWATVHGDFFLFRYGSLGVQLFFLISGYVILMTLDGCASFREFAARRWLRLFPAMLIVSALIYASADLLPGRPYGAPGPLDFVPGLLFVQDDWINFVFDARIRPLEGVFWSLFVEVKFYLIFGLLYFAGRHSAVSRLTALFLLCFAVKVATVLATPTSAAGLAAGAALEVMTALSLQHFGWFASGAWLYRYMKTGQRLSLLYSAALLVPNTIMTLGVKPEQLTGWMLCAALYLSFVLALKVQRFQPVFSFGPLLFLGSVSYPLYLMHENALIALAIRVHDAFPALHPLATPLPGLGLILALSWAVAAYGEPWLRRAITQCARGRRPAPRARALAAAE